MPLCASFIPANYADQFRLRLEDVRCTLGKKVLHSTKLRHHEKVYIAKAVSGLRIRLFTAASYKPTLSDYSDQVEQSSERFYNKCVKYLLERIGEIMIEKEISQDRVYFKFEERNHNYSSLIAYISKVRMYPIYPESGNLVAINPMSISVQKKKDEPLFIIPDLGAHALYSCFNKSDAKLGILEPRYLKELSQIFHRCGKTRTISDFGIKYIHKLRDLNPYPEIRKLLASLKAG